MSARMTLDVKTLLIAGFLVLGGSGAWSQSLTFPFDGLQQWVQVNDAPSLDVGGELTIEAWVLAEAGFSDEALNYIVDKSDAGTSLISLGGG
jgi:hypothetical protein